MRERFPIDVTFLNQQNLDWPTIAMYDIIFFQRPAIHWQMNAIERAKKARKIVWVDWDDNIFAIPNDNPAKIYYSNPQNQAVCTTCIKLADIVTVSTSELQEIYKPHNPNVFVAPNALPSYVRNGSSFNNDKQKVILWRGTNTHDRDLDDFEGEIIESLKNRPDWKIIFFGYNPWRICEALPGQAEFKVTSSVFPSYFEGLFSIRAAIGIVPLSDHIFNKCKSNIALLEMGLSGATCVVPNWKDWQLPGVSTYTNPQGFKLSLEYLMDHEKERLRDGKMTHDCVKEKFKLSTSNNIRWHVLKQIVNQVMPAVTSSHPIYELTEKVSSLSLLNAWPTASRVEFPSSD